MQALRALHRPTVRGLAACPALPRHFSVSAAAAASQRELQLKRLRKEFGADYHKRTVPTRELLDALRDMQAERALTNNYEKSAFYRDARRAVSLLVGPDGDASKPELSIGEIEGVLAEDNGVSWALIRDLAALGHVPRLTDMSDEKRAAIEFNRVFGIGDSIATRFAEEGYRSLDEIAKADKIAGRRITDAMRLSIKYLPETEQLIPRAEVDQHRAIIQKALQAADPAFGFEIMGSYRRGEEVVSDIDVVVTHESFLQRELMPPGLLGKVITALHDAGVLDMSKFFSGLGGDGGRQSNDPRRLIALTRLPESAANPRPLHRQIDVRVCPIESLPYMLVGNTGDDMLMKILRGQAKSRGLTLNEYGMGKRSEQKSNNWPVEGTEVPAKTEKDIFDHLEVPYLEPHQRSFRTYSRILPRRLF